MLSRARCLRRRLASLLVLVTLVGGPTLGADAAPPRGAATRREAASPQATARDLLPQAQPLVRGVTGALVRIVKDSPRYGETLRALRKNEALINSAGVSGSLLAARKAWVPFVAASRPLRKAMTRSLLRDLNARSAELAGALERGDAEPVWDTIFVGAGVHAAIGANALGLRDRGHRMLVVEATDVVSANFRGLGENIRINSSSRANDGRGVQPFGRGDNNPFPGSPVNVPDIDGNQKWPTADTLADVATVALATSGADVLTRTELVSVADVSDAAGPRYQLTLKRGGKTIKVTARNVNFTSGLGDPDPGLPTAADSARVDGYIARERAGMRKGKAPAIAYYSDAMELATDSVDPLAPYRVPYRKQADGSLEPDVARTPEIAVIGPGDSGKTFVELLLGLAPAGAYEGPDKLASTQLGAIGNVDWIAPGQFRDCLEFIDTVRARYSQGSADIKAGRVRPLDAKVVDVRPAPGGRYNVEYKFQARPLATGERVPVGFEVVAFEGQSWVIPTGEVRGPGGIVENPEYFEVEGAGADARLTWFSDKTYDRVIFATGFKSRIAEVARRILPSGFRDDGRPFDQRSDVLEFVRAEAYATAKTVNVAKRIKGTNVFLTGPAAGKDLVTRDQTVGVKENTAAIKFLGPYTAGFATDVLAPSKLPTRPRRYDYAEDVVELTRAAKSARAKVKLDEAAESSREARWVRSTGLDFELVMKHELAVLLDGYLATGFAKGESLRLTFAYDAAAGELTITSPLAKKTLEYLAADLAGKPALVALLRQTFRASDKEPWTGMQIEVDLLSSGTPDFATLAYRLTR